MYLKQLFKGAQDKNIACHSLTPQAPDAVLTLQIRRAGSCVAAWLDGNKVLGPCNIGDTGADPGKRLGLWVSATENPNGGGAQFSFLRVNGLGAGALRCPELCSATHVISGGCSQ